MCVYPKVSQLSFILQTTVSILLCLIPFIGKLRPFFSTCQVRVSRFWQDIQTSRVLSRRYVRIMPRCGSLKDSNSDDSFAIHRSQKKAQLFREMNMMNMMNIHKFELCSCSLGHGNPWWAVFDSRLQVDTSQVRAVAFQHVEDTRAGIGSTWIGFVKVCRRNICGVCAQFYRSFWMKLVLYIWSGGSLWIYY